MPVYKDKNGTWYFSFKKKDTSDKWRNVRKRGFKTKREASAAEREAMDAVLPVSATFREVATMYEDYKDTSEVAKTKHAQHLKYRFPLADEPMAKIDKKALMLYRAELAKMDFSTTTKNQTLAYIRTVIRFGSQFYGFEDISKVLLSFRKSDEEVLKEFDIWEPEEFNRFIDCVDSEIYKLYFTFVYWTGCRRGEAIAVQKENIGDHCVTFKYSQNSQKAGLKPTKGRSRRTIKIDDILFNQIQPLLETAGKYLFGGDHPLTKDLIQSERLKAIEKSGVKPIRLHDFRHSHATWLINNGVNIVAVSRRLGHKDIQTTLRVYAHLLESSDNDMIQKINLYKSK